MKASYKHCALPVVVLAYLATAFSAQATGDFTVCKPGTYHADSCLKAHNEGARENNKSLDLMDLADHAVAAGDKVAAFGHWSLAARSDKNPVAMYQMGAAFYNGDGAPQSDKAAAEWFRKSADLNYAAAQYMLGALYANGRGLDQSDSLAMEWYQKAADQNQPDALHSLAYYYYQGKSVPQDYRRAAALWRRAAEDGYVLSQANYGWVLFAGEGVKENFVEAETWTRKAATAGNAYAKTNLGEMYEYGRGVPVDLTLAEKWYREAAAEGVKDAEDGLARLEGKIEKPILRTTSLISAAEMTAVEWEDCTAHFYFLVMSIGDDDEPDPDTGLKIGDILTFHGMMAAYASDARASADAAAGIVDERKFVSTREEDAQIIIDTKAIRSAHETLSTSYPSNNDYVMAYRAKCMSPINAFTERFNRAGLGISD